MIESIGKYFYSKIAGFEPWGLTLALCRTALAIATLVTLLFNGTGDVFRPILGSPNIPSCVGISQISIYCLLNGHLDVARWISIGILVVTISGYYPRITCVLHWWVTFSFISCATIVDGGDQIASVLTLLLIPLCLLDPRVNHWNANDRDMSPGKRLFAYFTFQVIRLQIAFIYFQACVSKFSVTEWVDGTAVYYWFLNPMFGVSSHIKPFLTFLLSKPLIVAAMTWGALAMEFIIFLCIMLRFSHPVKKYVFIAGVLFHGMIMVIHGLVSFFFSMSAALIIYLLPLRPDLSFFQKRRPVNSVAIVADRTP